VTDRGAPPAGEYSSKLASTFGHAGMAEEVNPAIKGVEAGGSEPVVDRFGRQPDLDQLLADDEAPLSGSELRDPLLTPLIH
jgi:hypothetical protein